MKLLFILLPAIFADSMALQQTSIVPVWGKADPGSTITLTTSWNQQELATTAAADSTFRFTLATPAYLDVPYGEITLRQQLNGDTHKAKNQKKNITSEETELTIRDILFAEVWLAGGQSNMEMPMHGFWGQPVEGSFEAILHSGEGLPIRFYKTPRQLAAQPQFEGEGKWYTASPNTTGQASAIAYFYAHELSNVLQTPVAIVESTWGGTRVQAWMPHEAYIATRSTNEAPLEKQLDRLPYLDINDNRAFTVPTAMYNAMIHPIAGFAIKGLIMYHGETNIYFHPETYSQCFSALIKGWRKVWNQGNWPVYFVQIAPFDYGTGVSASLIRSEQDKASQHIPNSGMVVTMDIGDSACIHPTKKLPVAQRLVGLALRNTYGFHAFDTECPRLNKTEMQGNEIKLIFTVGPQLLCLPNAKHDIEIADALGQWHPAKVKYTYREMRVWSEQVSEPHGVRYCCHNYTIGTLFSSTNGLPVAPFEITW